MAGFVGYKFKDKFIGGVEYNYQFNYNYVDGQDRYGYSVYGSYYLFPKWQLFARFDHRLEVGVGQHAVGDGHPQARNGGAAWVSHRPLGLPERAGR